MSRPFTDNEILNALDCCAERPNRKCHRCPLFNPDNFTNCDKLEYWAYSIMIEQRTSLKTIRINTALEIRDSLLTKGQYFQNHEKDYVAVDTQDITYTINTLIERTKNEGNFS